MAKNTNNDKEIVKDWSTFSMTQQSEKDIRNRILTKGVDSVCVSYICRYSRLSESFIEELEVLSTGLIKDNEFYKENFKAVSNGLKKKSEFIDSGNLYKKADKEKLGKITLKDRDDEGVFTTNKAISSIRDRLDWVYISQYQSLSEEFIIKHSKNVHWGFIFKSQNVSKEFRKKYGNNASTLEAPMESEE